MLPVVRRKAAILAALIVTLFPVPARAQVNPNAGKSTGAAAEGPIDPNATPRPVLRAFATDEEIILDGRLDEEAWAAADSTTTPFYQIQPRPGYPSSERTVVRILYDSRNIYLGVELYDSEPDRLTIPGLEQDFATQNSDMFAVAIDSYWDKQSSFLFGFNPAGAVFDAQSFNDSRYLNPAWEGVVHVKTQIHDRGWTIEAAIPFTTLRFSATDGEQTWGLNFSRRIRRRNEDSNWAPLPRQFRLYKMSRAGTLTGLHNLSQGRNLAIKPFVTAARQAGQLRAAGGGNDVDAGFDIKYGVTSRLTLDLTALTDFSQVEVDREQVNLTRFSLFFPEKRDFFLENDGVFTFSDISVRNYRTGSSSRNFKLFHSRRIGLSSARTPLPIAAGGRLTGRAGGFEVGFLNMQTRVDPDSPAENFAVIRLRRDITGNSDVGVMFVNRQGTSSGATDDYNRAFGVDGNFRLLGNMILNSYVAATDEPGETRDQKAAMLQVAWRDPVWDVSALFKHVGDGFNPEVGFVNRRGVRQLYATVGAHPQPDIPHVLRLNPHVDTRFYSNLDGTLETRELDAGLSVTFLDGSVLTLGYEDRFERLLDSTRIAGVRLPPGGYDFNTGSVALVASGGRPISGRLRFSRGGFYDGDRTSVSGNLQLRPSYHLALDFSAQHNALTLSGNSFTADLFSARVRYAYSTKVFFLAFVQFNESTDELVTNFRLNVVHAPLSDIFLVYTERRNVAAGVVDGAVVLDRVLTAKVTKLIAF